MNTHIKSPTLYEANQTVCDDLAKRGYTAVAEMAKHFQKSSEMSRALGFDQTAVSNWMRERNPPGWSSNARADEWLFNNVNRVNPPTHATPISDPTTMLMVVCDNSKLEKVQKILGMIGCEVVEL
jgi:hypothetical protein